MSLAAGRLRVARPRAWVREAVLFLTAYLLYGASRWILIGRPESALEHARWIAGRERALGVAIEGSVQRALDGTAALWLLDQAYLAAQVVVVPAALAWLYRRDRAAYRRLRDTVLVTWLLALPVFWLFPVAPPRLAHIGIADSITQQTGLALGSRLATSFYNPLAAVPSLHCGFALAVALALARTADRRFTRAVALAWAPTVCLAVVATGNHFLFDVATGVAITLLGSAAARVTAARRRRRARRGTPRRSRATAAPGLERRRGRRPCPGSDHRSHRGRRRDLARKGEG